MATHPITCPGPCGTVEQLGTVELPDDTTPAEVARALAGYLCEPCGTVYSHAVAEGQHPAGEVPTPELVETHADCCTTRPDHSRGGRRST